MAEDEVLARRAVFARRAGIAKRVGWSALLVAIVAFFVGLVTDFAAWTVTLTIAGLVAACVILPVPIIIGYGVRAADREDRERGLR